MAHGYPDWGHTRQEVSYALTDDLAELAARLGCISVFDRRGSLLWMDDFSQGIGAWETGGAGTGTGVAASTSYPKWPPNCIRLTGGSDDIRSAYMTYRMGFPPLKRLGFEASIAFLTRFDLLYFYIVYWNSTEYRRGLITLSDTDRKLYYETTDGVDVELDDLADLVHDSGVYHSLKLAVDFGTDKYIRFLLDDESYDLSAYALREEETIIVPQLAITCYLKSRDGENDYCQVDGVILTQDEP